MTIDFLARVPATIANHAQMCLNSPETIVQGAYLTGTVIGQAQGKQAVHDALEADAAHRAESFATYLGARPTYPWEQPRWDRRRLRPELPESLTGRWQPKPQPVVDRSGPWPTTIPPTHEPVPLAVAA
ncbi:hypothetical protein AB0X98_06375 [Rothia koreensis]|uniref:hypothetical protein n=1 Tax=Rothia koreensis TaxID=592378 RepID=UPI003F2577A5